MEDFKEVEIPRDLIIPAYFAGLIAWKDGGWEVTEKGQKVLLDYVNNLVVENG